MIIIVPNTNTCINILLCILSTFYNRSPLSRNNNNYNNAYAYDALGFVKRRHITMMMMIAYTAALAPHTIYNIIVYAHYHVILVGARRNRKQNDVIILYIVASRYTLHIYHNNDILRR